MKFQLSVATLERLIGSDTEFEVSLKQAAASEFAKRHMGTAVSESVQKELTLFREDLKSLVHTELMRVFDVTTWDHHNYIIPKTMREGISKTIREEVVTLVKEQIRQAVYDEVCKSMKEADLSKLCKQQVEEWGLYEAKAHAKNELRKALEKS